MSKRRSKPEPELRPWQAKVIEHSVDTYRAMVWTCPKCGKRNRTVTKVRDGLTIGRCGTCHKAFDLVGVP